MRRTTLALIAAIAAGCAPGPDTSLTDPTERLDRYVDTLTSEYPGLRYGVVDAQGPIYGRSAGYRALNAGRPITDRTEMPGFSLSKLFTSLVVVQLAEQGQVDLDAELRSYLDWLPYPGTVRHVLSHSAGLPDVIWGTFYIHFPETHSQLNRAALLREVVTANEPRREPGEQAAYTNLAYALLGALIEERTGLSYEDAVQQRVFEPLGMAGATFDPFAAAELTDSHISRSPISRGLMRVMIDGIAFERAGRWTTIQREYYFDLPAHGGVLLSGQALETFLVAVLARDARLLSQAGYAAWTEPQSIAAGEFALGWHVGETAHGPYIGHDGGAMGVTASVRIYPELGIATFFQSNVLDSMRVARRDMDRLDAMAIEIARGSGSGR